MGNMLQFVKQLIGVASVWVSAFVVTSVLAKLIDVTIGLRVEGIEETVGDGKIFVLPVDTAVRIRTSEAGENAI